MNTTLHFSTGKDTWETPIEWFKALDSEFHFVWDLAASAENTKCAHWLGPGSACPDALQVDWYRLTSPGWCNPPYSRGMQKRFIQKAAQERLKGFTTVMLLPARTDTAAFHDYIWDEHRHTPREGIEVRFLYGRLQFTLNGASMRDKKGRPTKAPFPSMIVIFHGA